MSNENFDNNIRKKLESIKPDYSSDAWKKLRAAMPLPWYATFFKEFGGWIYGGLASIALLASFYSNYITNKENDLLHEEISTLKNNTVLKSDTVFVNKTVSQTDTVYVVKYIIQKQDNRLLAGEGSSPYSSDGRAKLLPGDLSDKTAKAPVTDATRNDYVVNTTGNDPVKEQGDNDSKVDTSGDKKEEVFKEKEDKEEAKVPELKIPAKEEIPEEKKKFKFPYIHARIGIGSDYLGFNLPALGPDIEVFLNDRISFNTGLLISGQRTIRHSFAKDFNIMTGKRFEDEYKTYIIETRPARIENISIKTSLIKLPLFFNYYVPASKNLSFVVSAGTKLDLSVYQEVTYTSGVLGDQYNNRFEASPKPATFNSLFYGLGLQYKYRRFVGQFSPYFDFPFRNLPYGNAPRKFGINASLKIDLGKK